MVVVGADDHKRTHTFVAQDRVGSMWCCSVNPHRCPQCRTGQWPASMFASNRQYLWIKIFYAASSVAVVSSGRSTSLPFSNFAPARTSATRWGALTARQRDWAASISL